MRTVTIKEINQLALAKSIVASNIAAASNLMATLNAAVGPPGPDQRWDKIPAQNIKRDVDAVWPVVCLGEWCGEYWKAQDDVKGKGK